MINRRDLPGLVKRVKHFIWPKKGFIRAWKYLAVRLSRMKASPHAIAAGFAAGAASSFTPLLGLHILLGFAIAFVTRGSMIATVLGTAIGNPVTFPLFFSTTYWVGAKMKDFAASEPSEGSSTIIELFDEQAESEADAAADAVLDVAEDFIEGGWSFGALDAIWPVLSTMLIGAILVVPVAYAVFYFAMRAILQSFGLRGRR